MLQMMIYRSKIIDQSCCLIDELRSQKIIGIVDQASNFSHEILRH
jgi:hypothetical protein